MELLKKSDKIFVAGHRGLVGGAITKTLREKGFTNLLLKTRQELDLLDQQAVFDFYKQEQPNIVFVAAAKVGGIQANNTLRADFIYQNLQIQSNLIWGAHLASVRRLVFLGSSCVYPKEAPQPMPEHCLLTSSLEQTNRPYALAKISGLELVQSLRRQYQRDYFSVMPTNLYGPNDNFDPENAHVLPALIRRFCEAKRTQAQEVMVWGTGKPLREFMLARECASAIVFLAENLSSQALDNSAVGKHGFSHINIGSGHEISISGLAQHLLKLLDFDCKLTFNTTKPDGTLRKLLDCRFLNELGWKPTVSLETGLKETIEWYKNQ